MAWERLGEKPAQRAKKAGPLGGRPQADPTHPFGVPKAMQGGRAGYNTRMQEKLTGIRGQRQPGDMGAPMEDPFARPGTAVPFNSAPGGPTQEDAARQQWQQQLTGIATEQGVAPGAPPGTLPLPPSSVQAQFDAPRPQGPTQPQPAFGIEGLPTQTPGRPLSQSGVLTPEQTFTGGTDDARARQIAGLTGIDQKIAGTDRLRTGMGDREYRQSLLDAPVAAGLEAAGKAFQPSNPALRGRAQQVRDGEDVGAFNPNQGNTTLADADKDFSFRRQARQEAVRENKPNDLLNQGQIDNIAGREQELDRRGLRSGLKGMGMDHQLSDAQADSELRKQSIMARLKGDPNARMTEDEWADTGHNPDQHPLSQARSMTAMAPTETGAAAGASELQRLQQSLTGTQPPWTPTNPGPAQFAAGADATTPEEFLSDLSDQYDLTDPAQKARAVEAWRAAGYSQGELEAIMNSQPVTAATMGGSAAGGTSAIGAMFRYGANLGSSGGSKKRKRRDAFGAALLDGGDR